MSVVHYGCTALVGTNKVGELKPDADGRYKMILAALDYPNSVGATYSLSSAEQFFKPGTPFMRKVENGQLRAEYGHPKREDSGSDEEYFMRLLRIHEENVCAHISDLYIDYNGVVDRKTGRKVVVIIGMVKPCGPMGPYLKEILDDPKQNAAFSLRCTTDVERVGFTVKKHFTQIITFDYVNEPGLALATKYNSPSLESADIFDREISLDELKVLAERRAHRYSLESNEVLSEIVRTVSPTKPAWMTW